MMQQQQKTEEEALRKERLLRRIEKLNKGFENRGSGVTARVSADEVSIDYIGSNGKKLMTIEFIDE